jgi:UDPglucose 6-dehydrogenase
MGVLEAVDTVNQGQRHRFIEKILHYFDGDISGKTFAVWGLAFKPRTDDMREAPSITIINTLLANGAKIKAFDPKAFPLAKTIFKNTIEYSDNSYEAAKDADALLLLTEWNEFRRPDFDRIKALMKRPVIFDGRNQYEIDRMQQRGFTYFTIGRLNNSKELGFDNPMPITTGS